MRHANKLTKRLSNDECRVIRIGHEAIYELLKEIMIEKKVGYFDLSDSPHNAMMYWNWDDKTGDFICFVSKDSHLDFDVINKLVPVPTTDSLFQPCRYLSVYPSQTDH